MAKLNKGEQASLRLRPAFGNEDFSFEDAKEYLLLTDFGMFYKQTWNAMIKKGILEISENGMAHFSNENSFDGPINSEWTNENRKYFICEENESKRGYGDFFTKKDLPRLNERYMSWKQNGEIDMYFGCRRPTAPEVISEGIPSAIFGYARTNNLPLENIEGSADLVDPKNGDAIQVKSFSSYNDDVAPSSFGPHTKFDRLIAMYIRLDEDKAYFYELPANEYQTWPVNETQTVGDQQAQGRRPRLNLLKIVKMYNLDPFAIYDFKTGMI